MSRSELLRAWVAALEGEKYKQVQGTLRSGDRFCCLGVACDVSDLGEWKPIDGLTYLDTDEVERPYEAEAAVGSTHVFVARLYTEEVCLPRPVSARFTLDAFAQSELQEMNDSGHTFPQIAARIRAMFPDVFPVAA